VTLPVKVARFDFPVDVGDLCGVERLRQAGRVGLMEWSFLAAEELSAALGAGEVTSVELTDLTERLGQYAEQGITEIIYQPTGPDIARELERFITAAHAISPGRP
jgi:hypothetical protein